MSKAMLDVHKKNSRCLFLDEDVTRSFRSAGNRSARCSGAAHPPMRAARLQMILADKLSCDQADQLGEAR